jgi:hydrogenase 3 maturation protease
MVTEKSFEEKLKAWLSDAKKVTVVGVGNMMRKDDAVGVEIVKRLQGKVSSEVMLVEAETMPENHLEQIIDFRPSHVLIIDSGLIGKEPGDVELYAPAESVQSAVSSHMLPIHVFSAYLERAVGAKVLMLIVQPKETEIGEGLTKDVANTAKKVADFLTHQWKMKV